MPSVTIKGGDRLNAALNDLARKLDEPHALRVGFLEGATYPDGTSVPLIAAINEFGAPSRGQPPRPFFRNMVAAKSPEWPDAIAGLLKRTRHDAVTALEVAGEAIAGQLRQSIVDLRDPPLAPSTIARKGFDKPLIDTSVMVNSIDYEVDTTRHQGPRGFSSGRYKR